MATIRYMEDTTNGTIYHRSCLDDDEITSMKELTAEEVDQNDVCGECGTSVANTPDDWDEEEDDEERERQAP